MSPRRTGPAPTFRERLRPAWWVWASAAGLTGSVGLIFVRLGTTPALVSMAPTAILLVAFLLSTTPTLEVADGVLHAGRARIPLDLLGEPAAMAAPAMRIERGTGLDARAYLVIRGWVDTGVKVGVHDPDDPTPYWLISSRRPDEFAAAIGAGRRRPAGESPAARDRTPLS